VIWAHYRELPNEESAVLGPEKPPLQRGWAYSPLQEFTRLPPEDAVLEHPAGVRLLSESRRWGKTSYAFPKVTAKESGDFTQLFSRKGSVYCRNLYQKNFWEKNHTKFRSVNSHCALTTF